MMRSFYKRNGLKKKIQTYRHRNDSLAEEGVKYVDFLTVTSNLRIVEFLPNLEVDAVLIHDLAR